MHLKTFSQGGKARPQARVEAPAFGQLGVDGVAAPLGLRVHRALCAHVFDDRRVARYRGVGHPAIAEDLDARDAKAPHVRCRGELLARDPLGRRPADGDDATRAAVVVAKILKIVD